MRFIFAFSTLIISKKLILIVTDRSHFTVTELHLLSIKVCPVCWGTVRLCASCAPSDCVSASKAAMG